MPGRSNQSVMTFNTPKEIGDFLIARWKDIIREACQKKGQATIALSGEKSLLGFYDRLASRDAGIDWQRVHIFFTDESFILSSDSQSSYGKVYPVFFKYSLVPDQNFHQVPIMGSAEESSQKYQEAVRKFFKLREGELPEFDIVMLEVGEDGHTASLFPNTDAMTDNAEVSAAVASPSVLLKRITLKPRVFTMAKNVFLVATGIQKAAVVADLVSGKGSGYTASRVKPSNGDLYYVLDVGASSMLPKP